MIIGIDASNLRAGGGVTHLIELLLAANPEKHGFEQIIVWGSKNTLDQLPVKPWLQLSHVPMLDKSLLFRTYWQQFKLSKLAQKNRCDLLFVPGGNYRGNFCPYVTMFRNMLPFDPLEVKKYFPHLQFWRFLLLRESQSKTFKNANGIIFLAEYARDVLIKSLKKSDMVSTVIPHGISRDFAAKVKSQQSMNIYNETHPFRLLYVSTIDCYKHQIQLVEAVSLLRKKGFSVVLDLIGSAYLPYLNQLHKKIKKVDPSGDYIHYLGAVPYTQLPNHYATSDVFVYPSSCENFPNILLEAMASGLPIACSNRGVMPEILKDAGVYFDPEDPNDIARTLEKLLNDSELRQSLAKKADAHAKQYSWTKCANDTFKFLAKIVEEKK